MITSFSDWNGGAEQHEKNGNPRYVEFCNTQRSKCHQYEKPSLSWMERYKKWLKEQADVDRVQALESRLAKLTVLLETIVCTVEPDKGIILLSDDAPTHLAEYDGRQMQEYDLPYFSELGGALIAAWELARGGKS